MNLESVVIGNVTWQESLQKKATCDICVGQFRSGAYGVSAVESMAMSQPVLGYVNCWTCSMWPELPIVQATLNNLIKQLQHAIENTTELGACGRNFVEHYHSNQQTIKRWKNLITFVSDEKEVS